ncbi:hypothetical protein V8E53_008024 [Lactarius tabidus]
MPLILAEALLDPDSAGDRNAADTDTEYSSSSEDEELPKPTQATGFAQRVAVERPSWPASAAGQTVHECQGDVRHGAAPDTVPSSFVGDNTIIPGYNQEDPNFYLDLLGTGTASDSPPSMTPAANDHEDRKPVTPPEWPAETNLRTNRSGKLKLMDQSRLIRDIIMESFTFLRASIILEHAFPDPVLTGTFVMRALVSATSKDTSAASIRHRILNDHAYLAKIIALPRARISVFRAEVKERCVTSVSLLINVQESKAALGELIDKQLNDNYNYIFPRRSNGNILSAPALCSHPYRSPIIISIIRDLFFTGRVSFVTRNQSLFPSHQASDGAVNWEVSKLMVALVATAYYAALNEWLMGEHKHFDFTTSMNLDVYNGHIDSLDKIESTQRGFYHRMMADIYHLASSCVGQPPLPIPTLDMSMLEFFEDED